MTDYTPDLIIYNAGTDILVGDPLGKLDISADGIKLRDEIVFKIAKEKRISIVMLTRSVYFLCSKLQDKTYFESLFQWRLSTFECRNNWQFNYQFI